MSATMPSWWIRWLNPKARYNFKTFFISLFILALVGTIAALCSTYFPFKNDMDTKSDDQTRGKMMDIQWSIVSLIVVSLVIAIVMIILHATSKPGNCNGTGQKKYCITDNDVTDIKLRVSDKAGVFNNLATQFGKVIKKL
jgi:uncharacterized membrane protein YhaH (DUF805 family)